tara:strand:- start:332 stop:679 length:348 start_codon:yes stop_codon:yes gene_type:complete
MRTTTNRRAFQRANATLPCKVLRPNAARYLAARTSDVSQGGALIEITTPTALASGERLRVGVAWIDEPILRGNRTIDAEIVRVTPLHDGRQTLAIRFDSPQIEAAAIMTEAVQAA